MVEPTEIQHLMSLDDWDIRYKTTNSRDIHGEVEAVPEYKRATVFLHPDTDDFEGTVIHELMHVILWEFSTIATLLAKSDAELECLRVAEERAVTHLESMRVWDVLKGQGNEGTS